MAINCNPRLATERYRLRRDNHELIRGSSDQPWWSDYLAYLEEIDGNAITDCDRLNSLLPDGLTTQSGHMIRFVPSTELDDTPYEYQIYTTGRVNTRPDSWHDLFNALVWMRFPRIKAAMNALHFQAWDKQHAGRRGKVRDALTLFDECGVIVFSTSVSILDALVRRNWKEAFLSHDFGATTQLALCGHAMLEKYLAPYKSMTAKALFVHVGEDLQQQTREKTLATIDEAVAKMMLNDSVITQPADLGPLPLAGVPTWWPLDPQDEKFYGDLSVFRLPPADLEPAPVLHFRQASPDPDLA